MPKYNENFLPAKFSISSEGCLFYEDKRIATGYAKVISHEITIHTSGKKTINANFELFVGVNKIETSMTLEELKTTEFTEFSALYFDIPFKQNLGLFKQTIRYQLSQIPPQTFYGVDKLGISEIQGTRIYCFGNRTINPQNLNLRIADSIQNYALEYTPCINEQNLANGLDKFLSLNPSVSLVLMAYLTLGLSRQLFLDAKIPIKFVLFIVGQNQSFKTTLSSLYFNLYNRHQDIESHLYNFTSTEKRLIQVLGQMKDCPIIFDDLNKSDSQSIMRSQEQKASSLIRIAANNVSRETMHESYDVKGQLVFCGEYMLENMSTCNRTFLLQFSSDMFEKEKITELKNNADVIPQFAFEYAKWLLANYEKIKRAAKNSYQQYLKLRQNEAAYQERLNASACVLRIAFELFTDFCEFKGWNSLTHYAKEFTLHTTNLMNAQIEVQNLDGEKIVDLCCDLYIAIYEHDKFNLDADYYKGVSDYFYNEKKDLFCITGSAASTIIFEHFGKTYNYYNIFNDFYKLDLLEVDRNKNGSRTKKIGKNGKRYYCIRMTKWQDYVRETLLETNHYD